MRLVIAFPPLLSLLQAQQPVEFLPVGVEISAAKYKGAACVRITAKPRRGSGAPQLDATEGAVALWIGPGTVGHFRNPRITS